MAVISIREGASGFEGSVAGSDYSAHIDMSSHREPSARTGLTGEFHSNALGITSNPIGRNLGHAPAAFRYDDFKR